ncbi:MAG: FecR domain-containing protein [Polyangiales bacterium]
MAKPDHSLPAALSHIDDRWDAARTERGLPEVHRRLQRARRRRALLASAGASVAMMVLAYALWPSSTLPDADHITRFEDGSQIELLDANARIVVDEVTRQRMSVQLLDGRVHVEVARRPERRFRVRAGDVVVEVLGTAFDLERAGPRTRVAVTRGRVAVHWPNGSTELAAGEAGWFPKEEAPAEATAADGGSVNELANTPEPLPGTRVSRRGQPAAHMARLSSKRGQSAHADPQQTSTKAERRASKDNATGLQPSASAGESQPPQPATADTDPSSTGKRSGTPAQRTSGGPQTWQIQAERGDYKRAYELMPSAPEHVADDVEELLLAADAARLSGHPTEALPYLRRIADQHPRDPRAPLAAFTLAGVLLNQLDRPQDAEAAYARARTLTRSPVLAQDALARQIECAHRAGNTERTRTLARDYLRQYPDGRRAPWVRELSGL